MLIKIDRPDDPERCQTVTASGQCINKSEPGATHCEAHGANIELAAIAKKEMNNYRINKYKDRLIEKSGSNSLKSLTEEIAILRMLLEERFNSINNNVDLLIQSQAIADLVLKIEKCVTACHKLDEATGKVLDRTAVVDFADRIISIISEEVKDSDALVRVANRIGDVLGTLS